jgi:hypothetical protein
VVRSVVIFGLTELCFRWLEGKMAAPF